MEMNVGLFQSVLNVSRSQHCQAEQMLYSVSPGVSSELWKKHLEEQSELSRCSTGVCWDNTAAGDV